MQQGKRGIIYKYTSPSGKVYIGQTTKEKTRRYVHSYETIKHNVKFGKAISKYGLENFKYEVLFATKVTTNLEQLKRVLDAMEVAYIFFYDSYKSGYNSTKGGGGILGFEHSLCAKEKISKAHIGKVFSKETREKMAKSATGRLLSKESKQKVSDYQSIAVLQFTKNNEFVKEWKSAREATQTLNIYQGGICKVCKGKLKTAGGFIWKYKNINNNNNNE